MTIGPICSKAEQTEIVDLIPLHQSCTNDKAWRVCNVLVTELNGWALSSKWSKNHSRATHRPQYYFEHMVEYANQILAWFSPYWDKMKQISDGLKELIPTSEVMYADHCASVGEQ